MHRVTPVGDTGFVSNLTRCLDGELPTKIGVALSGGGDSTALLVLLARAAQSAGLTIEAITVDHGLRPEAAAEADQAAALCGQLGVGHEIVKWHGWTGAGNLQEAARNGRRALIADWAHRRQITVVALGHTLDDQAETLLMRLARGSGVDGLSAMARSRSEAGIRWIRPLLDTRRADLRAFLQNAAITWSDDPGNEDRRFERIRIRQAMSGLATIGLTIQGLGKTADRLYHARVALEQMTAQSLRLMARATVAGNVEIDRPAFVALNTEMQRRVMAHGLRWVGGNIYRPRLSALDGVIRATTQGVGATLSGCLIRVKGESIQIGREPASVASMKTPVDQLWDGRWSFHGPSEQCDSKRADLHLAALGPEGLRQCKDWRKTGIGRTILLAAPAVWCQHQVVSAPIAGFDAGWRCKRVPGPDDFTAAVLSH